jgi:hypothetical protein
MEVVPAADAMRRIAASSIPTSTRSGELVFLLAMMMNPSVGRLLGPERRWKVYSVRGQNAALFFFNTRSAMLV